MDILLINDDGIKSSRLKFAQKELEKIANVWVVAPKEGKSGSSMSITVGSLSFEKIDDQVYVVDGTPIDCYLFAKHGLKLKPDWVVSGVNNGLNVGMDIQYSGTYAVAKRATMDSIDAIAFSASLLGEQTMTKYFLETFEQLLKVHPTDAYYVLNVNFPDDYLDYKGIRFTNSSYQDLSVSGKVYDKIFITERISLQNKNGNRVDNEIWALKNGYTSVTQSKFNRYIMF
jgi:5'-nucleotidase